MSKFRIKTLCFLLTIWYFFFFSVFPVLALVNFTYDQNGNMTSDGLKCYVYNDANQVYKVKDCTSNKIIAEYLYDYTGRRIVKKEYQNGSLKQTTYTPDKSFETKKQATDSSTLNSSYYFVNDESAAKKNPDGSKIFYHNDHLNSTNVLTNASGQLLEETTYYPYGDVRAGGSLSKYLFTGQEKDLETGLNYYGARYYNSHITRFTQADTLLSDPYDPQQLNRYSYVRNNPLKYTDPSGHCIWDACLTELGIAVPILAPAVTAVVMHPEIFENTLLGSIAAFQAGRDVENKDYESAALNLSFAGLFGYGAVKGNLNEANVSLRTEAGSKTINNLEGGGTSKLTSYSNRYLVDNPATGWKVGDPLNNGTLKGNVPSWPSIKQRFWKTEASLNTENYSPGSIERMNSGKAPLQLDPSGEYKALQLHHNPPQREGGLFQFNIVNEVQHLLRGRKGY